LLFTDCSLLTASLSLVNCTYTPDKCACACVMRVCRARASCGLCSACLFDFVLLVAGARSPWRSSLSLSRHVLCVWCQVSLLFANDGMRISMLVCTCLCMAGSLARPPLGLWGTWLRDFCAFLANVASPRAYLGVILKISTSAKNAA